jgi:tRNA(Ile)-lysidine synthase
VHQKVKSFISDHQLLKNSDQVALAISGGKDSVFAAHILSALEIPFIMVHLNFSLRGKESDGDALFVAALATTLPYCGAIYSKKVDTSRYADTHNLNTQLAAREIRYNYFQELKDKGILTKLITAHHSDDEIETFFINANRSAGLGGLSGIPIVRDYIIRPFLSITSAEIKGYLQDHALTHREDSSNSSEKYLRNTIRHSILPIIEDKVPGFKNQLQKSIGNLKSENSLLTYFIEQFEKEHFLENEGVIKVHKSAFLSFPHTSILLYRILDKYGFNHATCEQIAHCFNAEGGRLFHSTSHTLATDSISLVIKKNTVNKSRPVLINGPGTYTLGGCTLVIKKVSDAQFSDNPLEEIVSIKENLLPLTLRFWKKGDKIQPLGMKGSKLLSDFFIDQKINVLEKDNVPLICKGHEVLCIAGHRISEKVKAQNDVTFYSLSFTFEQ